MGVMLALRLLLLLLTNCTPALGIKPQECLLYPVNSSSSSWDLESGEETDIRLTTEATPGVTRVEVSGKCLLSLHYHPDTDITSDPKADCFHVGTDTDEVMVAVLLVKDVVMVRMEGTRLWKEATNVTLSSSPTIKITTDGFVNVGFNCKEGCFQVRDTILGKSFKSQLAGSLVVFGKISDEVYSESQVRSISVVRGKRNWSIHTPWQIRSSDFNRSNWTKFNVKANFKNGTEDSCRNVFIISCKYETVKTNLRSIVYNACIMAPRLILRFNHTNGIDWSVCKSQNTPSNFPLATTCSSATTPSSATSPSSTTDSQSTILTVTVSVLVVVCLLLVLALTATCVRLQRGKGTMRKHLPLPTTTTTTTTTHLPGHSMEEEDDDPANHVYDYVDLTAMNAMNAMNGPSRLSCANSLYGEVI
ncbi:hypothetical protein Pmani_003062 [Petrolisthes manimaculis]|uniref:Uncharacterized protein n=1 Tax=Petrolisthes manimaculis TaxID=1843537 RepID=A0AAE1QGC9_9EUCA|nr:hypothetical protein Pmani_003062 [Petrolisthes manimaculis]